MSDSAPSEALACVASKTDGNVGLAFGIVTAAGLSTTIGAALAFVLPFSTGSKNLFLAACLALAAGVMIYVSFVEIFAGKAVEELSQCLKENLAYLYATLCFFVGIAITAVFDMALHHIQHAMKQRQARKQNDLKQAVTKSSLAGDPNAEHDDLDKNKKANNKKELGQPSFPRLQSSSDTSSATDQETKGAPTTQVVDEQGQHPSSTPAAEDRDEITVCVTNPAATDNPDVDDSLVGHGGHLIASIYNQTQNSTAQDAHALIRMGVFAGIALAFHNFPEGLATFVSVLEDPSVGTSVAIAIAIHNIPEGVCVAMPIYYATGSRFKAFMWATLSGMTELVGAFLGWVVLRNVITPAVYGVLFGVVAGMMVYISLKELIPTAHRYDPNDQVTSIGVVGGMIVMAVSLVLFEF